MDISIQLNNIREQYKNMENQFDFLIAQSQNMGGLAIIQSPIFNMAIQILNMGIQMVNIGTQIPSIGMDIINYKNQIQNIGFQIQNLGNQMNNPNNMMMPMNNNILNMGMIVNKNILKFNNFDNNNDWVKGFEKGMESKVNINNKPKQNVIFQSNLGGTKGMHFDYGTTIGDALKKYLIDINKPEFIRNKKIYFLYNGRKINLDDETKIEKFFEGCTYPQVLVQH